MLWEENDSIIEKVLLCRDNIRTGLILTDKDEAIRTVGQMLVKSGNVKPDYVEAMIEREKIYPTYLGYGLALPHGKEAARDCIISPGIAVITLAEPVDWDGSDANIVVGIAGVGDELLDILGNITNKMMDEETANRIITGDADTIYELLK